MKNQRYGEFFISCRLQDFNGRVGTVIDKTFDSDDGWIYKLRFLDGDESWFFERNLKHLICLNQGDRNV